jgi:hypothetical protein
VSLDDLESPRRTLASLLRPMYDDLLAPAHLEDLRRSGLTDATIRAHFIRSVPPAMVRGLLGFDPDGLVSALAFPFRSPAGGFMDHLAVKVFPTLRDARGHTVKYLQRKGAPPRLYFTIAARGALDGAAPLWLVEGLKQSLAVGQLGLPAVGFCGIEGWHPRASRELLPDFDALALRGRVVELVPDGDWQFNAHVRRGVLGLCDALLFRGARPRVVVLPSHLDDFLQGREHDDPEDRRRRLH